MLADLRSHLIVASEFRDFVQSTLEPGDTLCLVSCRALARPLRSNKPLRENKLNN